MTGCGRRTRKRVAQVIYFDNAATTRQKPPAVAKAIVDALGDFGGVGRGAHEASLDAGVAVYEARAAACRLFDAPSPSRVSFTCNVTESLNIVVAGLLGEGDHAITTAASHNSVLRPLYRKQDEEGMGLSILPVARDASIDYDEFEGLFRPNTKLALVTHASNLTGDVYDVARMADICHAHGALLVVDAAQTAGVRPIDMTAEGIDVLCFTGHKSLFGPQGTGGLCVREGVEIPPFKVGGAGFHSYDRTHPDRMPESLEAGTINAHGIAGLRAGIDYIQEKGIGCIEEMVEELTRRFEDGVREVPGATLYGGHGGIGRTGIVALNVGDVDSGALADALSHDFGICTRAGAHCAPLMHEALGTEHQGAVRFSFSHFNTQDEIDAGIEAIGQIARGLGA